MARPAPKPVSENYALRETDATVYRKYDETSGSKSGLSLEKEVVKHIGGACRASSLPDSDLASIPVQSTSWPSGRTLHRKPSSHDLRHVFNLGTASSTRSLRLSGSDHLRELAASSSSKSPSQTTSASARCWWIRYKQYHVCGIMIFCDDITVRTFYSLL
jgi:hypothetical protein